MKEHANIENNEWNRPRNMTTLNLKQNLVEKEAVRILNHCRGLYRRKKIISLERNLAKLSEISKKIGLSKGLDIEFNNYKLKLLELKEKSNSSLFDENGINKDGFKKNGIHYLTETKYNKNGYDMEGYSSSGYDKNGYNEYGYDKNGFPDEYDIEGYNIDGIDRFGYDYYGDKKKGKCYK